jgi:hypothetical protein
MRYVTAKMSLVLLVLITAGFLTVSGCGDDGDPVGNDGNGGQTYGSPNGQYDITSSNVNVTIVDSNVPSQLLPIVEQWIKDIIDNGGSSTADVSQNLLLLLKTESPVCVAAPYVYSEGNRSCSTPARIDVEDFDVSSMGLCQDVILVGEHCVQTVTIAADITPTLVWPANFATFSGSEAIGSAQDPAEMTVLVSGRLGGTFYIDFYASRDLSGARCSDCASCPTAPIGPSPNGDWDVTSTVVNVTVTSSSLPSQLTPLIEGWISDVISNGGRSVWTVAQSAVVLSRIETKMCAPMVYVYDPISRRCTITTPVDISNVDVSALGLCEDIIVVGKHCLQKISIDADFTPNLQWTQDFESFNGSEMIGSSRNPASATVTVTGAVGGEYNVRFHSSRNVTGTRCSECTPCR